MSPDSIVTAVRPVRSPQTAETELVGSLNSKDVQIFSKAGKDWNAIEVRAI